MSQTLGDLADLGSPERFQQYQGELPFHNSDACQARPPWDSKEAEPDKHVCSLYAYHDGNHASVSLTGLVHAVWINFSDPNVPEDMRPDHEERLKIYDRVNQVCHRVEGAISDAMYEIRRLREEAEHLQYNDDLLSGINTTLDTLDSMESDAWNLGVDEEEWV